VKTLALIGTAPALFVLALSGCAHDRSRDVADYGGNMSTTRPAAEVVACLVRTLGAAAPVQDAAGATVVTAQGADPARYTVSTVTAKDGSTTTQVLIQSITPNIDEERRAALCALPQG
jgi:hypothetical protein